MIMVERDTQKEIVIGKGGAVLKEAGTAARKDLEERTGKKVITKQNYVEKAQRKIK